MLAATKVEPIEASRVAKRLWVGSAPAPGDYQDFDVIVLVAKEYQPPAEDFPGVIVRRFPFSDDPVAPTEADYRMAWRAAEAVADDLAAGRRVLVTCRMGRNRSGFVAALAIVILTGIQGSMAYDIVSSRRTDPLGFSAISRREFRHYLYTLE